MKNVIVVFGLMVFLLLPVSGCLEQLALVGGGAAGAMSWDRFITQAQEDVEENIQLLEADNERLKIELATTTDQAEREKLQTRIKENNKWLEDLGLTKISLAEAKKGLGVDWKNPEAAAVFILGTLTAYMQWRKQKKTGTALKEVVAGGQTFKGNGTHDLSAFKKAHNDAQSNETKKMVAALRIT
jgi:hypothetical protein